MKTKTVPALLFNVSIVLPFIALAISIYGLCKKSPKFYNGEGNKIPIEVIKLQVKGQFVHLSPSDSTKVAQYFYIKSK